MFEASRPHQQKTERASQRAASNHGGLDHLSDFLKEQVDKQGYKPVGAHRFNSTRASSRHSNNRLVEKAASGAAEARGQQQDAASKAIDRMTQNNLDELRSVSRPRQMGLSKLKVTSKQKEDDQMSEMRFQQQQ